MRNRNSSVEHESSPPAITRSTNADGAINGSAEREIRSTLHNGHALPESTRSTLEHRFGHDFSDVRIHTDAQANAAAESINAHAFTMGSDIAFANGSYDPHSHQGRTLLAHELTHVVQHDRSSTPSLQRYTVVTGVHDPETSVAVGNWALDVSMNIPGYLLDVIYGIGLGLWRTLQTHYHLRMGIHTEPFDFVRGEGEHFQALGQTGRQNEVIFHSLRRIATDREAREFLMETVVQHWLGEVYDCLPADVRAELLKTVGYEASVHGVAYGISTWAVSQLMKRGIGESIRRSATTIFIEKESVKRVLQTLASSGGTVVPFLLKIQGMLEKATRGMERMESDNPALFAELDEIGYAPTAFLIEAIEEDVKAEIRATIEAETGMPVPEACKADEGDRLASVSPEEMADALTLMYGVPTPFPDMDYSMWFPDSWDFSGWEDSDAKRDIEQMADAIYHNMEAYQDDYAIGMAGGPIYGAMEIGKHPDDLPLEVLLTYDGYAGGADHFEQFHHWHTALQTREIEIHDEAGHTFVSLDDPFTYTYPEFVAAAERDELLSWR